VKGKTLAAARRALVAAHCRPGLISRAYSKKVAAGRVISQTPAPRGRRSNGSRVKLTISRGRKR
jgi:beta-lactam-binding protein with PASTA domain